jgi:flagellin-like protein
VHIFMRNQKGLSSVEALLILVVITIIGNVGCSRQVAGKSQGAASEASQIEAKQPPQQKGLPEKTDETAEAQEPKIMIPMTAKEPEGFAPAGWKIDVVKRGDLNGDKIDDAAIVMTRPEIIENGALKEESTRFLALAFGDGARFKRTALSDDAVLDIGQGGGQDQFKEIRIERGAVVIVESGGRQGVYWKHTWRYRWQQNRWMLIGRTWSEDGYFRDTNLSTGFVNCTDPDTDDQGGKRKPPKKGDYYELQAITISEAQKIDGLFEAGEWQGYVLKLNAGRQVVRGVQSWKGDSDVSAVLNAVRKGEDLFVRAEVTDDQFSEGDSLRLVNKTGQVIAPKEIKTAPTPKGYNVEARYSMRDLAKLAPEGEGVGQTLERFLSDDPNSPGGVDFSATVEVIDVDAKVERATLSTSLRGSPFHGSISVYGVGVGVLENK